VPEAAKDPSAIEMNSNASVTSPEPPILAVKPVLVMVFSVEVPVLANHNPAAPIPALQNTQPVEMATDAPVPTPEPAARAVEVILLPEMPVRTHLAPFVQHASTVQMVADPLVTTPRPSASSVPTSRPSGPSVVIFAVEHPASAECTPSATIPAPESSQSVEVAAHTSSTTPGSAEAATDTPLPCHLLDALLGRLLCSFLGSFLAALLPSQPAPKTAEPSISVSTATRVP
jgi:hypothetical protein